MFNLFLYLFNIDDINYNLGVWWQYVLIALGFVVYIGLIIIVIKAPVYEIKELELDETELDYENQKIVSFNRKFT